MGVKEWECTHVDTNRAHPSPFCRSYALLERDEPQDEPSPTTSFETFFLRHHFSPASVCEFFFIQRGLSHFWGSM